MNLEPIDFSTEDNDNNAQVEKRTRISFERDPLSIMMDRMENDEEICDLLENL